MSTGAAEVVTTKSVSSWADLSNDQQCEMHGNDNGNNNFTAVQETFEASFPADAAKGFAHSASLDPTATERAAGLRVEKEEGVACQLWWLPVMLGVHDTGNRVVKKVAKVSMFSVRSSPCLAPDLQSSPSLHAVRAPRSPAAPPASRPAPRPAPHALRSTLSRSRRRSTSR